MATPTPTRRIVSESYALPRRRLLQLLGAGAVVSGVGTGVAGAQTLDDLCEAARLDVVVALDRSGSMSLGTPTRMARAKAGATALVNALNVSASGVHAGVLTFAGPPAVDIPSFQGLSDDPSVVLGAISSIPDSPPTAPTTNMEAAVQAAREELTGNDYSDDVTATGNHRADAPAVLVLLGDGQPTADNAPADLDDPTTFPGLGGLDPSEEAEAAKSVDDMQLYTIGVDLDATTATLMETMASEPTSTHAFTNVDVDQIVATFEAVAADICPTEVDIDIKPGSDPNAINCRSARKGVISVALLGSDTFDVTTVDPSSLRFGSPSTVVGGGGATLAHAGGHLEDVNGDGYTDLVGHYPVADAGFVSGDVQGVLVGETVAGDLVAGVDDVKIVGRC